MVFRTWDDEGARELVNLTKDALIAHLIRDGLLTADQGNHYIRNYHVEVQDPSWISRWWGERFGKKSELYIILLKQMNVEVPEAKLL